MQKVKIAILDLNDNFPNRGISCIKDIVTQFGQKNKIDISYEVFDIRGKEQSAGLDFDHYISSGGPGSPLDSAGSRWESKYFSLIESIRSSNKTEKDKKKKVFFICHSFQLICREWDLAKVSLRNKPSFGVYPTHKTPSGKTEEVFEGLNNPFYIADFRKFQVTEPNIQKMEAYGSRILSREKIRPHIPMERALMAVRFTPDFIGTQFHPEADAQGMADYFREEKKKKEIIAEHGEEKFNQMVDDLLDPVKISLTHQTILPNFLEKAIF